MTRRSCLKNRSSQSKSLQWSCHVTVMVMFYLSTTKRTPTSSRELERRQSRAVNTNSPVSLLAQQLYLFYVIFQNMLSANPNSMRVASESMVKTSRSFFNPTTSKLHTTRKGRMSETSKWVWDPLQKMYSWIFSGWSPPLWVGFNGIQPKSERSSLADGRQFMRQIAFDSFASADVGDKN